MLLLEDLRYELARQRAMRVQPVNGTLELVGESFIASEPTIFGKPNEDYIERELEWYLSGSLNVNDIPGGAPRIWKQVATPDGEINSNYGFLFFSEENGLQLDNVVKHLLADPLTRRATAVYTRPTIHQDWNRDGMSDFICTNAVQYLIRDGRLDVIVQMRSNDVVFGYRNDYAWHKYCQQVVLDDLNYHRDRIWDGDVDEIRPGRIIWHAASLHIYERHFHLLDHFLETGDPFGDL